MLYNYIRNNSILKMKLWCVHFINHPINKYTSLNADLWDLKKYTD